MGDLLSTKVLLTVSDITIAMGVVIVLLIVIFFIGRMWERFLQPKLYQTLRMYRTEYHKLGVLYDDLMADMNIMITTALKVRKR